MVTDMENILSCSTASISDKFTTWYHLYLDHHLALKGGLYANYIKPSKCAIATIIKNNAGCRYHGA